VERGDLRGASAERAIGIAGKSDGVELLAERVVGQHAADERLAETGDELDRFERLQAADDTAERADDTGFASPAGRTVDLHLTVTLAGRTPFQTMVREIIPPMAEGSIVPGSVLGVRGNPDNRHQLVLALPGR